MTSQKKIGLVRYGAQNDDVQTTDWHHPSSHVLIVQISDGIFQPVQSSILNNSVLTQPCMIDDDSDADADADAEVLVAEPEVAEPPMYAVVMYNDDYTPMDFVVHILQSQFKHNIDQAIEIMLSIHHKGRGIAGIFPKDIAETKANKTNQISRKEGYPLLTQIEPHIS